MLTSTQTRIVAVLVLAASQAAAQIAPDTAEKTNPSPSTQPLPVSRTPREVAERVMPSVVLLIMEDEHGQPATLGSGFVAGDGIVATNHHVIDGAARGFARLVGKSDKFAILGVVGVDERADLVLLSVENLHAPSLTIGDSSEIKVGDEVFVVGNPEGLEGTFSQGIVSGIRHAEEDHVIQITAPISSGSSGGPVLNKNGEVIGVAVGMLKDGQNLNFAIPASYLSALLAGHQEVRPFGGSQRLDQPPKIVDEQEEPPQAIGEPRVSVEALRKAASDGDPDAMYKLGEALYWGQGVLKNRIEAVRWYRKAADSGHTLGMYSLGCMYQMGHGIQEDHDEAIKWLQRAAEKECHSAFAKLAFDFEVHGDIASATYWWRKAAEHPEADASDMRDLGKILLRSPGIPGNAEEAVKWFRLAADRYRKDAEKDRVSAMLELADMYDWGQGVPQDDQEAAKWVQMAAKRGQIVNLWDVPQDMWVKGKLYERGFFGSPDYSLAAKWYRRAIEYGNVDAMCDLGVLLNNGLGVAKDDVEAGRWFRKAAEQGHSFAMLDLGLMYVSGSGVPQDEAEAYVWCSLAAAFGESGATVVRDALAAKLTPTTRQAAQARSQELFGEISEGRHKRE